MFFSFIFVKKHGLENLPEHPDSPSIFVVNHTSCLDIFIMESIMKGYPHIWLFKDAYAKVPLFSILIKRMHIPVKRDSTVAAGKALLKSYKLAKSLTSHVIMFPEGTRHHDGKVHEFNSGFALLAKKLNRPVIPIAISGFNKIMPKKSIFIDYHATQPTMTIGKPLTIGKSESVEDFAQRTHNWFKQLLN
ncbi:1-acyl-sn-glycerol-3-phosphate acyltransferase [Candidatus Dependentiae bacterium]|nr:1-acyl-sn-glycerol-3-phosphate acyltransferase [Candidatus Dependentiae bacterium]